MTLMVFSGYSDVSCDVGDDEDDAVTRGAEVNFDEIDVGEYVVDMLDIGNILVS